MAHSAGLMQLLQAGILCNERTMKKSLLMALMLMMLCGCSQAAKSSSELIEEDIRNSDREACFIHAQEAANEGLDEAEAKILMATATWLRSRMVLPSRSRRSMIGKAC